MGENGEAMRWMNMTGRARHCLVMLAYDCRCRDDDRLRGGDYYLREQSLGLGTFGERGRDLRSLAPVETAEASRRLAGDIVTLPATSNLKPQLTVRLPPESARMRTLQVRRAYMLPTYSCCWHGAMAEDRR